MAKDWYFPRNDGGEEQGLNDAGIETFRTESSLAREVIQNSLDAVRAPELPVTIVFAKMSLGSSELPGRERLQRVFELARDYVAQQCKTQEQRNQNRVPFLERAVQLLRGKSIPFLRISDFNTTGLRGDEADGMSAWTRLIRKQGASSVHGAGGGTFGIGQRAPYASSELRTVFYSTRADGINRFIGKSIICSFKDDDGEVYRNIGFWGAATNRSVASVTGNDVPPPFRRSEPGLDLYVAGFNDEGWPDSTLDAVLVNAFAAIEHGRLVVKVEDGASSTTVDRESILDLMAARAEGAPGPARSALLRSIGYVKALRSQVQIKKTLQRCGQVSLFVHRDPEASNKIAYMRRPRILVYERAKNLLPGYAAVFLCDNDAGNAALGRLEDPTHRAWKASRDRGGQGLINEVQDFVAESLRELADQGSDDEEDVPDLFHFLPEEPDDLSIKSAPRSGRGGNYTHEETTARQPVAREPVRIAPVAFARPTSRPESGGVGVDEGGVHGANPKSGGGTTDSGGGPEPGRGDGTRGTKGSESDGLRDADLRCRIFQVDADGRYQTSIRSSKTGRVELQVLAVGEDDRTDTSLRLAGATLWPHGELLKTDGPRILGVPVVEAQLTTIEFVISPARRLALAVKVLREN